MIFQFNTFAHCTGSCMGRKAGGCRSISTTMARLTTEVDNLRFVRTTAIFQPVFSRD